jgi:hypothetical protein
MVKPCFKWLNAAFVKFTAFCNIPGVSSLSHFSRIFGLVVYMAQYLHLRGTGTGWVSIQGRI